MNQNDYNNLTSLISSSSKSPYTITRLSSYSITSSPFEINNIPTTNWDKYRYILFYSDIGTRTGNEDCYAIFYANTSSHSYINYESYGRNPDYATLHIQQSYSLHEIIKINNSIYISIGASEYGMYTMNKVESPYISTDGIVSSSSYKDIYLKVSIYGVI